MLGRRSHARIQLNPMVKALSVSLATWPSGYILRDSSSQSVVMQQRSESACALCFQITRSTLWRRSSRADQSYVMVPYAIVCGCNVSIVSTPARLLRGDHDETRASITRGLHGR
jgi:hypothetical protein